MPDYKKLTQEIAELIEKIGTQNLAALAKVLEKGCLATESVGNIVEKMAELSKENKGEPSFPDYADEWVPNPSDLILNEKEAEFTASKTFLLGGVESYDMECLCGKLKAGEDINGLFRFFDEIFKTAEPDARELVRWAGFTELPDLFSEGWIRPEYLLYPGWVDENFRESMENFAAIAEAGRSLGELDKLSDGSLSMWDVRDIAEWAGKVDPGMLAAVRWLHKDMPIWTAAKAISTLQDGGHEDPFGLLERIGFFEGGASEDRCWEIFEKAFLSEDPEKVLLEENPALIRDDDVLETRERLIAETGLKPYLNHCADAESMEAVELCWNLPDSPEKEENLKYLAGPGLTGVDRLALEREAEDRPGTRLSECCYPAGRFDRYAVERVAAICTREPALGKLLQESKEMDDDNLYGLCALSKAALPTEEKVRIAKELGLNGKVFPGTEVPNGEIGWNLYRILLKYDNPVESPVYDYLVSDFPMESESLSQKDAAKALERWVFTRKPAFTEGNLKTMVHMGYWSENALPEGDCADLFFAPGISKAQVEEMLRLRAVLGDDFFGGEDWARYSGAALRAIRQGIGKNPDKAQLLSRIDPAMTAGQIKAALAA